MAELGLNEHHSSTVLNYMRFARHQRATTLRSVDRCFQDLKLGRLSMEDTFTSDEVAEMIDGLMAVVRGDVESELINTAHTNVLLLRQLFGQGEKWHLKLQADISELENQDLLAQIKEFEEKEFSGMKKDSAMPVMKLEPLNDTGGAALLQMKITELEEENEKLKSRMKSIESQTTGILEEKSHLASELVKRGSEIDSLQNQQPAGVSAGDMASLQEQVESVKTSMKQNMKLSESERAKLEDDLVSTKHKLLEIQEHLEMAEKELDKKFQQTAAYMNMKKMLMKKNEQIKDLRKQLSKYEPDVPGDQ